jgi:hypothetical protein
LLRVGERCQGYSPCLAHTDQQQPILFLPDVYLGFTPPSFWNSKVNRWTDYGS